jgi:hypothetical protein
MAEKNSGGVMACRRNLLMKGTAKAQLDVARSDKTSRLMIAPEPFEYVAKDVGHAKLYVTVRADKI